MRHIDKQSIDLFRDYLVSEEKAFATVQKYIHDVSTFMIWLGDREITKSIVLSYKTHVTEIYAVASANSIISSLNSFFLFMGWNELKVKFIKLQKQMFASKEKELTKEEYARLLAAADKCCNQRLYLLMQCICSTGIRVSELKYITVESLSWGRA